MSTRVFLRGGAPNPADVYLRRDQSTVVDVILAPGGTGNDVYLGRSSLRTSVSNTLKAQWDVNTRGRTDNTFREWVNGVTETLSGGTSLDTSGTYDGINFNGTTGYCRAAIPVGLSATFADSDYTMAARLKLDTINPSWQGVFGAFASASNAIRVGILTEDANGDGLGAHASAGTSVYLDGATQVDDAAEHVIVQKRVGNVFSLWIDGTKINEQTVAASTIGALNRISFGVNDDATPEWYFDGTVKWAAIWSGGLLDAEIAALDDTENPFVPVVSNSIAATGILSITRVAGLKGVGKLASAGILSITGAPSLKGSGKLQSAGTLSISGVAGLKAAGKLAAAGALSITGSAGLKGKGKLAAAGTLSITGSPGLKATGKLQSSGTLSITGAANLKGVGKLATAGALSISSSANLSANNNISSAGTLSIAGLAGLKGSGKLASAGTLSISSSAGLKGIGRLASAGTLSISGSAGLKGKGKLLASGSLSITGSALLGDGTVSTTRIYAVMG